EALGTGHAVLAAERAVGRASEVLIANGDFAPAAPEDVRTLIRVHRRTKAAATMITTEVERPGSYSRIVRDGDRLVSVVAGGDAPAGGGLSPARWGPTGSSSVARTCSAGSRSWAARTRKASTT